MLSVSLPYFLQLYRVRASGKLGWAITASLINTHLGFLHIAFDVQKIPVQNQAN